MKQNFLCITQLADLHLDQTRTHRGFSQTLCKIQVETLAQG